MNLVIASYNLKDPEAWRLALGAEKVIHIRSEDKLKSFADIALALDELIYFDNYPVDWVLYCNNEKGIKWSEFLSVASGLDTKSDCLFLTQHRHIEREDGFKGDIPDLLGNFYCRPHVFNMLGGIYKLQLDDSSIIKESKDQIDSTKIFFAINRTGFDIRML